MIVECGTEMQVGDQPGRVAHGLRRVEQGRRRRFEQARRDEQRRREDDAWCDPAFALRGGGVPCVDAHFVAAFAHTQDDPARLQTIAERCGKPLGEPGVAFGPGEDAFAGVGVGA